MKKIITNGSAIRHFKTSDGHQIALYAFDIRHCYGKKNNHINQALLDSSCAQQYHFYLSHQFSSMKTVTTPPKLCNIIKNLFSKLSFKKL